MANKVIYDRIPDVVQKTMDELALITGRPYKLFDYFGPPNAEHLIVIMGSGAATCIDVISELNKSK